MAKDPPGQLSDATHAHWDDIGKSAEEILNVRVEVTKQETPLAALIKEVGHVLAHPVFFLVLLGAHLGWIVLNLPIYPWYEPWDPYPFVFLATIASIEAPFIALLVLMHQEHDRRIDELREEIDLQVSFHIEREVTMALRLLDKIRRSHSIEIEEDSGELEHMEAFMDPQRMMERLRRDLRAAEDESQSKVL